MQITYDFTFQRITLLLWNACSAATPVTAASTQPSVTKHQPAMEMDCHRIRNLDANRPFTGLQDAVERLLPFHVSCAHNLLPHAPPQAPIDADGRSGHAAAILTYVCEDVTAPSAWHMQVFGATDASTADAEQAAEENLQLTSGRRDTWDRQQAQVAFELHDRLEQLRGTVGARPRLGSLL
jgi:Conserved region of unknown function on GLTSCR protein